MALLFLPFRASDFFKLQVIRDMTSGGLGVKYSTHHRITTSSSSRHADLVDRREGSVDEKPFSRFFSFAIYHHSITASHPSVLHYSS